MKLIYLSNFFNHHQKPLADALFAILGENYSFIETWDGIPEEQKKLGYHQYDVPYVKQYSHEKDVIDLKIMEADVVIYGEAPLRLIKKRISSGKLTIRDDESRYKNPNRYLKWPVYTYKSHWINKGYLLCASAYAPIDYMLSGMNPKKCYRWGYFTEVKHYDNVESLMRLKSSQKGGEVSILWTGRLIPLKHPEYPLFVAKQLKQDNVRFKMNIIGTGKLESWMKRKASDMDLLDAVHFLGSMSPESVRSYMEEADIFLFTSDRREGWGAVLNESMSSGCAVVADGNIGSVPFLIKDGENGLIYKSTNLKDLYNKIKWLASHHKERFEMGIRAYHTMSQTWNGDNAAKSIIQLCEALLSGRDTPIDDGPCSHAPLIMRKWKGIIKTI